MSEASAAARIIVGLGNPGTRYAGTRHNVGWQALDLLAGQMGVAVNERRPKAVLGAGYFAGRRVVLAKPRTYMNNSGAAVQYLLARFGGGASGLLVIYDEMALPVGRIRLRAAGSDAGHNGIRDIIQSLGTTAFPRLRIGIGAPGRPAGAESGGAIGHVLGRFSPEEAEAVDDSLRRAADAVECLLAENIDIAMNRYN